VKRCLLQAYTFGIYDYSETISQLIQTSDDVVIYGLLSGADDLEMQFNYNRKREDNAYWIWT
jgi:hypothetical protein